MSSYPGPKVSGSIPGASMWRLVIGLLVVICSGCGRDNGSMLPTGVSDKSARWVEVKDGNALPSSLQISRRVFALDATTTIQFALPTDGIVTLTIYDSGDIEVANLLNRQLMAAGVQEVEWNASNIGSGVYIFTLVYQGVSPDGYPASQIFAASRKMMLLK